MDDDEPQDTTNRNDPRLGKFVPSNQNFFRYGGVLPLALKSGSDFGSWRSAMLILAVGLVVITALTYVFHLGDGLVYVLLLGLAILAALVWNQVLGHRR